MLVIPTLFVTVVRRSGVTFEITADNISQGRGRGSQNARDKLRSFIVRRLQWWVKSSGVRKSKSSSLFSHIWRSGAADQNHVKAFHRYYFNVHSWELPLNLSQISGVKVLRFNVVIGEDTKILQFIDVDPKTAISPPLLQYLQDGTLAPQARNSVCWWLHHRSCC